MDRKQRAAWDKKIDAAKTPKERNKLINQYAEQAAADDIARMEETQTFIQRGGAKKVVGGDGASGPRRTWSRGDKN